jgi:hypothetical protein
MTAERHTREGWWLQEAGAVESFAPLRSRQAADIVIVGGGYLGLWTAWHIKQLEPDATVAFADLRQPRSRAPRVRLHRQRGGAAYLGGEILARLALDRRDDLTRLPLVDPPRELMPPEPFRWAGGNVIRGALSRRGEIEDTGRSAGALVTTVAGLPRRLGWRLPR